MDFRDKFAGHLKDKQFTNIEPCDLYLGRDIEIIKIRKYVTHNFYQNRIKIENWAYKSFCNVL